ncbi:MAG: hypothetical protein PHU85_09815 [Phycisphaerae bacterium]|nr:hypothetical protein [Phycisphaerae bacterium]
MLRPIKTFLVIVLMTALIWAWAEQSQTRTLDKQTVNMDIAVPTDKFAICNEAGLWTASVPRQVTLDFNGPQDGIAKLSQMIERDEFPPPFEWRPDLGEGDDVRPVMVNLRDAFARSPLSDKLEKLHVVVTSVSPAKVELSVGRVRTYELPIVARFSDGVDRIATIKDEKAKVVLPVGLYDRLVKQKKAEIRADVQVQPDMTKPLKAVLAKHVEGFPIRATPAETLVTLNLQVTEYKLENVPVQPVFSRDFPWQDYNLESDKHQWRKTVVVKGYKPITAADVNMYLKFETGDKEPTAGLSRDVEIVLPEGFELKSPQKGDEARAIKFKFVKREERPPT